MRAASSIASSRRQTRDCRLNQGASPHRHMQLPQTPSTASPHTHRRNTQHPPGQEVLLLLHARRTLHRLSRQRCSARQRRGRRAAFGPRQYVQHVCLCRGAGAQEQRAAADGVHRGVVAAQPPGLVPPRRKVGGQAEERGDVARDVRVAVHQQYRIVLRQPKRTQLEPAVRSGAAGRQSGIGVPVVSARCRVGPPTGMQAGRHQGCGSASQPGSARAATQHRAPARRSSGAPAT